MQPAIGERKTGRRGRRPLRGARPETWRDTCGRGVPIGGGQTRDAGTGGVFRRAVIDRCALRAAEYKSKALSLYGAREESFRAVRRSGSGDRSAGDSVRNLFAPQLQLDEREIQKPSVFGGVLFHISFAVERNMAAGGINAGRGCSPQSENGKRAVGDAGPYGVRDRRHGEIRVGGVCPLGAVKRGTRERVAFSGGL